MKSFQSFRLDSANQCLWRGDERAQITPKAFDVLRYMVENAGRLVTQDELTWRQYYGNPDGQLGIVVPYDKEAAMKSWQDPHTEVNRFTFIPKGKPGEYAFGPSFVFTPIKWWTSPESGVQYPWWGEMKTPKGTFYLSPTFPAQESASQTGAFIEGALLLRKESIDGPVVARGFCEMAQLPALGAPITRGLPENPDLPFGGEPKKSRVYPEVFSR